MVKFCSKCGTKANPGVKFCNTCGEKLILDNDEKKNPQIVTNIDTNTKIVTSIDTKPTIVTSYDSKPTTKPRIDTKPTKVVGVGSYTPEKSAVTEVRDKDGLTASERAIVDSIDYEAIAAKVIAEQETPEYKAELAESTAKAHLASSKKIRNRGIFSLVFGILIFASGFFALEIDAYIYLMIAGPLFIIFGLFMFYIARQNKKASEEEMRKKEEYLLNTKL